MKRIIFQVLIACVLSHSAVAGFDEGVAAYQAGDLPLAVKEFRLAADGGDADAQFNFALMHERGIGVPKSDHEAILWYRKSAQQGNSNAQYNLAVLYENGRGSAVDFAEANHWYRKAAVQGDGLAVGNLGMLYLRGQGVDKNVVAGLALLLNSVNLDNSPENNAKQNIAAVRGLTAETIAAAQVLASEMGDADSLLTPLDRYLEETRPSAANPSQ